jgi:hypothetical protein
VSGARRGRPRGSKNGAGAAQPKPFRIVGAGGRLAVYIGRRAYPTRAREAYVTAAAIVTTAGGALVIAGEGVVTASGDVVRVTA